MEDEFLGGGLPPIVRDANRLLLAIEQCVRNFPRYHKYQIGSDLRRQAMALARLAQRAWRDRAQQIEHVARMVWQVDEIKLSLQLAKSVRAFDSFAQFESCAALAVQIGQQTGGWHRQLATRQSTSPPAQSGLKPVADAAIQRGSMARPNSLSPRPTPEVKA